MTRPLLSLLPALLAALPCAAAIIGNISAGDKQKDVQSKAKACAELVSSDAKATLPKIDSFSLAARPASQEWRAVFNFDKRSKELQSITFISRKALPAKDYEGLVKAFYFYTALELSKHFAAEECLNTPAYGKAAALKTGVTHPLFVFRGGQLILSTGLQRDKKGDIHVCFSLTQATDTALGSTVMFTSDGKPEEWANVPTLDSYPEGKAFLVENGIIKEATPSPAEDEGDEDEEPDEDEDLAEDEETDEDEEPAEDEEEAEDGEDAETVTPAPTKPSEPVVKPKPAPATGLKTAPTTLPQEEQDALNALFLIELRRNKEGMEKLVAAAKAGNGFALYELGLCHEQGRYGMAQNPELAEKTYRQAAFAGYALAMVKFGSEYSSAITVLGLPEAQGQKILNKTLEGAKAGMPTARYNLAIMLRYGYGIRKDVAKAVETMQQLAKEGIPGAAELAEEWAQ